MAARFLTRKQVAEELHISMAPAYALIRRGEIRAAKIGGRGDYRIGRDDLEAYIERTYTETERWIEAHPYAEGGERLPLSWVAHDVREPARTRVDVHGSVEHVAAAVEDRSGDLLVTGALHDPRVMVYEPAKWVAASQ